MVAKIVSGKSIRGLLNYNENKEVKAFAQAVPRYGKLDFFNEKGTGQKREQFEKSVKLEQSQGKVQGKAKEQEESKSLSVR